MKIKQFIFILFAASLTATSSAKEIKPDLSNGVLQDWYKRMVTTSDTTRNENASITPKEISSGEVDGFV